MSSGGSASTWWSGLAEVLSNDTVENAQIYSMAKESVSRVGKYLVAILPSIQCWGEGNQQTRLWSENTSWEIKRAKSWVEQRALWKSSFNSSIHFNTLSTSTEDNAHLAFLLQQFSYLLLLFLEFSQPPFVNAFCPLSAESWVWHVQDCRDLGSLNHHSAVWYIHIFPVLDWDPE